MRKPSSPAVEECYRGKQTRVFRLNRQAVVAALEEWARLLVHDRPDVVEVRLFGSLAAGNAAPGSDADLIIVVKDAAEAFPDRGAAFARFFSGIGVACDVFAYTEAELARLRAEDNAFIAAAWSRGVPLARRS